MRRKGLAVEYKCSLRTVDTVLRLMRKSGLFTEDIIEGGTVLVKNDAFAYALGHRDYLREQI